MQSRVYQAGVTCSDCHEPDTWGASRVEWPMPALARHLQAVVPDDPQVDARVESIRRRAQSA
ncbi:MAG: hypothetical protein Kow0022_13510 [Phycisphaerales bacterium]